MYWASDSDVNTKGEVWDFPVMIERTKFWLVIYYMAIYGDKNKNKEKEMNRFRCSSSIG